MSVTDTNQRGRRIVGTVHGHRAEMAARRRHLQIMLLLLVSISIHGHRNRSAVFSIVSISAYDDRYSVKPSL